MAAFSAFAFASAAALASAAAFFSAAAFASAAALASAAAFFSAAALASYAATAAAAFSAFTSAAFLLSLRRLRPASGCHRPWLCALVRPLLLTASALALLAEEVEEGAAAGACAPFTLRP